MQNEMNYLDRNEFNFEPSPEVIEAIRNFIGTGVEVYVDKTNQGPIHLKRDMTPEQVEKVYSIEQLQEIFTLGQEYEVYLVYNFEDVTKAKPSILFPL